MMTEYIIPAVLPSAPLYEVITLNQGVLQDYVGEYEYKRWNIKASVTRKDKKIFILPSDLEKTELFPISETAFRKNLKGIGGIEVDFSKNDNNKIDHMTVRIGFSLLNFDKIKWLRLQS
jgi:hypothetical protein